MKQCPFSDWLQYVGFYLSNCKTFMTIIAEGLPLSSQIYLDFKILKWLWGDFVLRWCRYRDRTQLFIFRLLLSRDLFRSLGFDWKLNKISTLFSYLLYLSQYPRYNWKKHLRIPDSIIWHLQIDALLHFKRVTLKWEDKRHLRICTTHFSLCPLSVVRNLM